MSYLLPGCSKKRRRIAVSFVCIDKDQFADHLRYRHTTHKGSTAVVDLSPADHFKVFGDGDELIFEPGFLEVIIVSEIPGVNIIVE